MRPIPHLCREPLRSILGLPHEGRAQRSHSPSPCPRSLSPCPRSRRNPHGAAHRDTETRIAAASHNKPAAPEVSMVARQHLHHQHTCRLKLCPGASVSIPLRTDVDRLLSPPVFLMCRPGRARELAFLEDPRMLKLLVPRPHTENHHLEMEFKATSLTGEGLAEQVLTAPPLPLSSRGPASPPCG